MSLTVRTGAASDAVKHVSQAESDKLHGGGMLCTRSVVAPRISSHAMLCHAEDEHSRISLMKSRIAWPLAYLPAVDAISSKRQQQKAQGLAWTRHKLQILRKPRLKRLSVLLLRPPAQHAAQHARCLHADRGSLSKVVASRLMPQKQNDDRVGEAELLCY